MNIILTLFAKSSPTLDQNAPTRRAASPRGVEETGSEEGVEDEEGEEEEEEVGRRFMIPPTMCVGRSPLLLPSVPVLCRRRPPPSCCCCCCCDPSSFPIPSSSPSMNTNRPRQEGNGVRSTASPSLPPSFTPTFSEEGREGCHSLLLLLLVLPLLL